MEVTEEMIKKVKEYQENELLNEQVELLELILKKIKDKEMFLEITECGSGDDWEGIRLNFSWEEEVAKLLIGEE